MATEEDKQKFVANLNAQIDSALNGPELPGIDTKKVGFVLMIFPLGAPPSMGCTITTNGLSRDQVAELLLAQGAMLNPPKPPEVPEAPVN